VNDPFVIKEFAEELKAPFPFISDGSGKLTKEIGAGLDLSSQALGFRSRRFIALVEGGEIKQVFDEEGPQYTEITEVEKVLEQIQ
jgi:peroxiredoxin